MWSTLLAYLYALAIVSSWLTLGRYNDATAPLFWRAVLVRVASGATGTPAPSVFCDLLDRAQVPRDPEICADPAGAPKSDPPADQAAP